MTIKRGLKRLWIISSTLWVILATFIAVNAREGFWDVMFYFGIVPLVIWWALYWGISGFFGDEKEDGGYKDKGESGRSKIAFKEHQRIRFQPLRTLLDELVASFDREYIETKIWDGNKIRGYEVEGYYIAVGTYPFDLIEEYVIEPGFFFKDNMDDALPIEKGFIVTKLETDYNSGRKEHEFQTEEEVIQYLAGEIAKAIALWQHTPEKHKYTFSDASKELSSVFSLGRWWRRIKGILKL